MAFAILLESGDQLLLESGDVALTEEDAPPVVVTAYLYSPPTRGIRPGDALSDGWNTRAPGVQQGYLVISTDGVVFERVVSATPAELTAANFYALGGHETTVTPAQKTAIEASGVGGTFVAVTE